MHGNTRGTRYALTFAATLAISGCHVGDVGVPPINDRRTFDLPGQELAIDSTSDLRLVPGRTQELTVSRRLTGKAAEDGNASWTVEGNTLRLTARCRGLVIECGSLYTVEVPAGVAVSVKTEGADVTANGLAADLRVRTTTGDIGVTKSSGTLRLTSGTGDVTVEECGSSDVEVRSRNADHTLAFDTAPRLVVAGTSVGDVSLTLPDDSTRYQIEASARRADEHLVEVASFPGATNRIAVDSPGGRVRIAKQNR